FRKAAVGLNSVVMLAGRSLARHHLWDKALAVAVADQVMVISRSPDPFRHARFAFDGHFEEVRALRTTRHDDVVQLGPGLQVRRVQELECVALQEQSHDPLARRRVPDDLRIAIAPGDMTKHRIAGVLGPRLTAIIAIGDALREWLSL